MTGILSTYRNFNEFERCLNEFDWKWEPPIFHWFSMTGFVLWMRSGILKRFSHIGRNISVWTGIWLNLICYHVFIDHEGNLIYTFWNILHRCWLKDKYQWFDRSGKIDQISKVLVKSEIMVLRVNADDWVWEGECFVYRKRVYIDSQSKIVSTLIVEVGRVSAQCEVLSFIF